MGLHLDIDHNSAELKISRDIYLRILGKALEQTTKDAGEMDIALSDRNFDKIQALSHRWKGDYANLRINELSEIARQLNNLVKDAPDPEASQRLYDEFKTHFKQLNEMYRNLTP